MNIVQQLPGAIGEIRDLKDPFGIWSYFFSSEMINLVVENTNKYIDSIRQPVKVGLDVIESECLISLLLISGVKKPNHVNVDELFLTNGNSIEIFRLSMLLQGFAFSYVI